MVTGIPKPMQILVGRLIAITFFGAFMATVHIFQNPVLLFIMGTIYFIALPGL